MRTLIIVQLLFVFQLSLGQSSQKDSFTQHKNIVEIGATLNLIPNFSNFKLNGWGDNNFHSSIFSYSYKRLVKPSLYLGINYSYLWTLSREIDVNKYPQQTSVIGKNLTIELGYKFHNKVLPRLNIYTSVMLGFQDVKEKNLIYYKPDFHHVNYANIGGRGLLAGISTGFDYQLINRVSVGLSSSFYRRVGFHDLKSYYKTTNRDFLHNFILVQPRVGVHL
jgi:hypothetical protein